MTIGTILLTLAIGGPDDFVRERCLDCHRGARAKAGLRLDALAWPPAAASLRDWIRVHDALDHGVMPPKEEEQPTAEQRRSTVASLAAALSEVSLAHQRAEGRVLLRRLTRTQHQNALNDLLGVHVELTEVLPDDAVTGGFDTVSSGLEVSAQHLLRYQQAADLALDAALARRQPRLERTRWTGRSWYDAQTPENRRRFIDPSARLDGDSIVFHASTDQHGFLELGSSPVERGRRYRIRGVLEARNSGGLALPALLTWIGVRPNGELIHVAGVFEAPAGAPRSFEIEVVVPALPLHPGDLRFGLRGWNLPGQLHPDDIQQGKKRRGTGDLTGPGLAVHSFEIEGPIDPWPPAGRILLLGDGAPADPRAEGERRIRGFLPLAFRRPVDEAAAAPYLAFFRERLDRGYTFADAMRETARAILSSPSFFYFAERPGPLDAYALASRLSFFLWGSIPDGTLLERAATGELAKPEVLKEETERLLRDPRAQRFVDDFSAQWLDLKRLHMTKPDPAYVEYDEHLLWSMSRETPLFLGEMLASDLPVTDLVHSDWTFLDERLARHYGMGGVTGALPRRSPLPPGSRRGGVITHAAILKVTANGTSTSPILRGAWVLDRLLGKPPSSPPPDIPALEPDIRGAATIRQQLEKHRALPACARCHDEIDPPGFALETYDVIGGWRDWYRGKDGGKNRERLPAYPRLEVWRTLDVEKGYRGSDGRAFDDIDGYKRLLLEDPAQIARAVAEKLLVYGTGGELQFADRADVDAIAAGPRGLRSILHAMVASRPFRNK